MASQRQLEANRANAKRSTGPRSANGKARSSKNALIHGLTAQDIVINEEDPAEFERLRICLREDFNCNTNLERELVDRLAGLLWRLRRVPGLEASLIRARQKEADKGPPKFRITPAYLPTIQSTLETLNKYRPAGEANKDLALEAQQILEQYEAQEEAR